jgi:glycosyltransferase involved in cell wall biosynthesis
VDERSPVVVVLPVRNEAPTVADVIERVPAFVGSHPVEVVVVDDGSTDGSGDLALAAGAKVIRHEEGSRGLGAAVRTGLATAVAMDAAAVAFLDADGEYDPAEVPALVAPILSGSVDYVVGSRFAGTIESMVPARRFGNRVLTLFTSVLAMRRLSDGQSGFRALGGWAARHAVIGHDYNYAQVLTLDLLRKGFRYAEVPIHYARRRHGSSFVKLGVYVRRVLPAMLRATRIR